MLHVSFAMKWDQHHGVFDQNGAWIAGVSEKDVVGALRVGWVAPEKREVGG